MPVVRQTLGVPQIKYGSYIGDGGTSNHITIGFKPEMVIILRIYTDADTNQAIFIRTNNDVADRCHAWFSAVYMNALFFYGGYDDDKIISLDSNGFTVDDAGSDADPNKNGETYAYIAFASG